MIAWLRRRKIVKVATKLLAGDPYLRSMAQSNQDRAFDAAVNAAAKVAGIKVDAEQVRLAVAALELELTHQRLVAEKARHDEAMKK